MAQKNINNNQATTNLNDATGVNATDTAFTTDGNTNFPTAPFSAVIGSEAIMVTSTGTGTNWTVIRGIDGTTATSHSDNALISFKALAEDFGLMKDETADTYYAQGNINLNGFSLVDGQSAAVGGFACQVFLGADQTVGTSFERLDLDDILYDPFGAADTTNKGIVIPKDGRYLVTGRFKADGAGDAWAYGAIYKNSTTLVQWITREDTGAEWNLMEVFAFVLDFDAGDIVQIYAADEATGSMTIAGESTGVEATMLRVDALVNETSAVTASYVPADGLHLRKTSNQAISATTWTKITWETIKRDDASWFNDSTDEFTVLTSGWYSVHLRCGFNSVAETGALALYDVNGATYMLHEAGSFGLSTNAGSSGTLAGVVYLTAGETYDFRVYTDTASTLDSGDLAYRTECAVTFVTGGSGQATQAMIGAKAIQTSGQTINNATVTKAIWDTVDFDTLGTMWEGVTNPDRITIQKQGKYQVNGAWRHDGASATVQDHLIYIDHKNSGGTVQNTYQSRYESSFEGAMTASGVFDCEVGDYFEMRVYHTTGSARTTATAGTFLSVHKIDGGGGSAVMAQARLNANWNVPSAATITPIDFDTEVFDTDGIWEGVTNPDRFTAPVDGYYEFTANFHIISGTNADVVCGYWKNGADHNNSQGTFGRVSDTQDGTDTRHSGSSLVYLAAGDYVQAVVNFNAGGGTTRTMGTHTRASLVLVQSVVIADVTEYGDYHGMALLHTETVSSSVASVDISSIPQGYKDLIIDVDMETADASDQDRIALQFGNASVDTGSNYSWWSGYDGTTAGDSSNDSDTSMKGPVTARGAGEAVATSSLSRFTIHDYAESKWTHVDFVGYKTGDTQYFGHGGAVHRSANPVKIIRVSAEGGNLVSGTIKVYGISETGPAHVAAEMYQSTGDQTITGAAAAAELTFDTAKFAVPSSAVSLSDNAFVAPVDGVYEVGAYIPFGSAAPNEVRIQIAIDDVDVSERLVRADDYDGSTTFRAHNGTMMIELSALEKVTFKAYYGTTGVARGTLAEGRRVWFKRVA